MIPYRGHRLHSVLHYCVDCGIPHADITDRESGDQCAQERVLKGRSAVEARQLPREELRTLQIDGVLYQEHKIYRGMLCTGTRYHVADPENQDGTRRQGREQ